MNALNIDTIRKDFPILESKVYRKDLIYFDNAATTQKPKVMIDTLVEYYTTQNSNSHSQHFLATNITNKVELVRQQILDFVHADNKKYSVVFTKGATEAINLVASSLGEIITSKDTIILTELEHHANLLPWQSLAKTTGASLDFIKIFEGGELDLQNLEKMLGKSSKLVSFSWVSNVLGIVNDVEKIVNLARQNNVYSLIDATQAVAHLPVDLSKVEPDFLVFSGHKIFGPTGIGVLIAKTVILDKLPAYQLGGEMVQQASLTTSQYYTGHRKFEAGTLDFAGIVGLSASLEYFKNLQQRFDVFGYEKTLFDKLKDNLGSILGLKLIGESSAKIPLVSFYHDDVSSYDLAVMLDLKGVAIRSGRHCAEPLHNILGINSSSRASLAFYNTYEEIDDFTVLLDQAIAKLR